MGSKSSREAPTSISVRNTHVISGTAPNGETLIFPENSRLHIESYGRFKRI